MSVDLGDSLVASRAAHGAVAADRMNRHHSGNQIGGQQKTPATVGDHVAGIGLQLHFADLGHISALGIDAKAGHRTVGFAPKLLVEISLPGIGAELVGTRRQLDLPVQTELAGGGIHPEDQEFPLFDQGNIEVTGHGCPSVTASLPPLPVPAGKAFPQPITAPTRAVKPIQDKPMCPVPPPFPCLKQMKKELSTKTHEERRRATKALEKA